MSDSENRSELSRLLEEIAKNLLRQADELKRDSRGGREANTHDVQEAILKALKEVESE